jgi:DNA repair protein RadD
MSDIENPEWFLPVIPREKQCEIYNVTCDHIKTSLEPAYVYASVSSGKTIMMAMIAKRAQKMAEEQNRPQAKILCLARTGELVEQNAAEMRNMGVRNSIFSASVGMRSLKYPVVVGSEGTVARALDGQMKNILFDILLIDECHQLPFDNHEAQYMKIVTEFIRRNPKLKIIGYTGSPWRGTDGIKGQFWKKELYKLDMWELVESGDVVPPIFGFGHDDVQYDLSSIVQSDKDGTEDFDKKQLAEMQKKILSSGTTTEKIMLEVISLSESRNCVLITCSGAKHIKECAAMLPENSYAVITEGTKYKERKIIKEGCESGDIKYVLQIGCWTVGVNIPSIDTIVILRRIGSLTLLTQLIGRGIRTLKQNHTDRGLIKNDCLVLDYSGTMESIGHLFNDPILEAAEFERAQRKQQLIYCPRCNTENSSFARRCRGREGDQLEKDGRCGFFWSSKICEKCGTENDKVSRICRECDHALIDPNANLSGKHYVDADLKPVLKMHVTLTKNTQGLVFTYVLPNDEIATQIFYPSSTNINCKRMWYAFMCQHIHRAWHKSLYGKPSTTILHQKAKIDTPKHITHRLNDRGLSIVHRKIFASGREEVQKSEIVGVIEQ